MNKIESAPIIIGKLLNIGGMLQRHSNRNLQQFGLNQQQFSIFFEIAKAGRVKQKDMVNRLLLEKAHVSKVVRKLHKMGLITITASDKDKRSAWLAPTPEGEILLNKCRDMFRIWHKQWIKAFDDTQVTQLLETIAHLQAVFEETLEPNE